MPLVTKSTKSTQDFLSIKEIRDGIVTLKSGSLRLVLICSSLNFSLKSPDEQQALILQYQSFLNSLDFHVQIFIQSRKLDIQPYLNILDQRFREQGNELIKIQTGEYIEFIRTFTESVNVMTKSFFVVVPYDPPILTNLTKSSWWGKLLPTKPTAAASARDIFEENRTQLEQRAAVVEQGLARLGVRTAPLGTEELVELYFKLFNPGEKEVPTLQ